MANLSVDLDKIASEADAIAQTIRVKKLSDALGKVVDATNSAAKAWSGSWLGYHSRIYYKDLKPIPPGARFDPSHGFQDRYLSGTHGDWAEYTFDGIYETLKSAVSASTFQSLLDASEAAKPKIRDLREELLSAMAAMSQGLDDVYLARLLKETQELSLHSVNDFVECFRPSGKFMSMDMVAIQAGLQTPPHLYLAAQMTAVKSLFGVAEKIAGIAKRTQRHLANRNKAPKSNVPGENVFIGHGRATAWRDLKDFLQDRLQLPWDEFNRVPVAGVTNIARLSEMLSEAAIAFLVMTAEDEQQDGKKHARMNVIHEAGLFQGRLGFTKAIVVLEDGCEEFSNINGLGQIRFPVGNIKACFEEIRQVLEREGLLEA